MNTNKLTITLKDDSEVISSSLRNLFLGKPNFLTKEKIKLTKKEGLVLNVNFNKLGLSFNDNNHFSVSKDKRLYIVDFIKNLVINNDNILYLHGDISFQEGENRIIYRILFSKNSWYSHIKQENIDKLNIYFAKIIRGAYFTIMTDNYELIKEDPYKSKIINIEFNSIDDNVILTKKLKLYFYKLNNNTKKTLIILGDRMVNLYSFISVINTWDDKQIFRKVESKLKDRGYKYTKFKKVIRT